MKKKNISFVFWSNWLINGCVSFNNGIGEEPSNDTNWHIQFTVHKLHIAFYNYSICAYKAIKFFAHLFQYGLFIYVLVSLNFYTYRAYKHFCKLCVVERFFPRNSVPSTCFHAFGLGTFSNINILFLSFILLLLSLDYFNSF